jgi:site-specific DNA recombinase
MASSNKKSVANTNKSKTGFRIAGYIRVSTEEQAENPEGSIKNQEERLHMTVKLKNMEGHFGEIVHVYVDRAKSGKDTNRPELQKLLLAIRRHEIDLVMVSELSRISRSIKDFSQIWELMQQNNCGFYSLRENFDTTTAAGEMVLFTVANIAQFERRQISERVVANFNVRAQRGLFNGGSIPLGFMRIPDKKGYLDIDEESAKLVRAAFKIFIQEGTLSAGSRKLNEMGYRIKSDREGGGDKVRLGIFTSQNLYNILTNQSYIGVKVYTDKGTKKQVPAVWPAIVDKDTFTKANEILIKNYQKDKSSMENRYPYILSGLIKCKSCGDSMVGKSAHGKQEKYGYYEHACSTKKNTASPGSKRKCEPYRKISG